MTSPFETNTALEANPQGPAAPELSEQNVGQFSQQGKSMGKSNQDAPHSLAGRRLTDAHERLDSATTKRSSGFARVQEAEKGGLQGEPLVDLGERMEEVAVVSEKFHQDSQRLDRHDEGLNHQSYLDPTPQTPRLSSPTRAMQDPFENNDDAGFALDIESIMGQLADGSAEGQESVDSGSTLEKEANLRTPLKHPPRLSSFEPLHENRSPTRKEPVIIGGPPPQNLISRRTTTTSESHSITASLSSRLSNQNKASINERGEDIIPPSPNSNVSLPKELPPSPDPEPDLPFDFHRFLEQLRHRTADPVARYLRSFLTEFGKKQWMAHEQIKFIGDFLTFIANKMAHCEVWREVSDAEFDNAKEGMEKLVMNRLYSQTFSPAIPSFSPDASEKGKRKGEVKLLRTGRRGQHQEDVERDDVLSQKIRIYGWVREEHLDIAPVGGNGKRLLDLAQQGDQLQTWSLHLLSTDRGQSCLRLKRTELLGTK